MFCGPAGTNKNKKLFTLNIPSWLQIYWLCWIPGQMDECYIRESNTRHKSHCCGLEIWSGIILRHHTWYVIHIALYLLVFAAILWQTFINQISEFSITLLVWDHHNLKTKVWSAHLGLGKDILLWSHLEDALNCRTKVEFEQYRSDICKALADRPKDFNYYCGYLDCPKSIARYKILEVRGSLEMVGCANAEKGHSSSKHAVLTQLRLLQ